MENFTKAFKWCVAIVFLILGLGAILYFRDMHSTIHLFLALCSFGMALFLSKSWFNTEKTILLWGGVSAVIALGITIYVPIVSGFYLTWAIWSVAVGLPFMTLVFRKYGD